MASRAESWVIVAGAVVAIATYAGWKSLGPSAARPAGAAPAAAPASATPQLAELQAFAAPLPVDSTRAPQAPAEAFSLVRDPFGASGVVSVAVAGPHRGGAGAGDSAPEETTKAAGWRVTATLLVSPRAAAVINDVLVYVGDPVPGGGKLTSVERDRVVLTDPRGGSHTVAVKEGDG